MRAIVVLLVLLVAAAVAPAAQAGQLTVFAAASLTEYLKELEPIFEQAHPGVTMRTNLAASSECRLQIQQGAPADVFLSADNTSLALLTSANLAEKPQLFAKNHLVLIAAKSERIGIKSPRDLTKRGAKLVLPQQASPIGKYTYLLLTNLESEYGKDYKARVLANKVSEEQNVKAVVAKVALGEADAAFCYVSDVTPEVRAKVKAIAIPAALNVTATYPLAVITASRQKALARDFVKLVLSPQGQAVLAKHGLIPVRKTK
jgi:molybdate transport system substrate-binding protein